MSVVFNINTHSGTSSYSRTLPPQVTDVDEVGGIDC